MAQTNPDGRTHAHFSKIVTSMFRFTASGLDKNHILRNRAPYRMYSMRVVCKPSSMQW